MVLFEKDKLAATTMNPHYQAYSELASPHSPGEGGGGYSNGHHVMGYPHHPLHHHHHHHHHHINNNNNNTQTNNNNNNSNTGSTGSPAQTNNTNNPGQQVKVCAGCGGKIVERFLLHALDRFWHNSCLKCTCCGAMLADIGSSCFTRSNMILCKADYIRLFGNSGACGACGQTIPANEFVMRAATGPGSGVVFHLKCFTCSKCGCQLVSGDRYYLMGGSLVCEQDWLKLIKSGGSPAASAASPAPGVRKGKVGRPRRSRD